MAAQLTSAERLERCLRGEPTDRVPVWMLYNAVYQTNPWYPNYLMIPSYAPVVQKIFEMTDIFQRHWFGPGIFYSDPEVTLKTTNVWRDQGYRMYETQLETPQGILVSYSHRTADGRFEEKPLISDISDLEKILSIPYKPFCPDLSEFRSIRADLGSRGLMMVNLCDPFSLLYFHCKTRDLLLWAATEAEHISRFLDEIHNRLMVHLNYLLDEGIGPVFFIVGSEFACPPMLSPRAFSTLVAKYQKSIIECIHKYSAYAIIHHHGAAQRILHQLLELEPDGIHPLEAPPVGDTPLNLGKSVLGEKVSLVGNIQYDTVINGRPEQLKHDLQELFNAWKPGGRFILAPSPGPYLETLSPQVVNNHLSLIRLASELGRY
jgi:uroporphyrinogen-III decarboxylase